MGDFNGDGRLDLATANVNSNTVSILLGQGDGTFLAARDVAVDDFPSSITVGDFNGDGHQDLATANRGPTPCPSCWAGRWHLPNPPKTLAVGGLPYQSPWATSMAMVAQDLATANLE